MSRLLFFLLLLLTSAHGAGQKSFSPVGSWRFDAKSLKMHLTGEAKRRYQAASKEERATLNRRAEAVRDLMAEVTIAIKADSTYTVSMPGHPGEKGIWRQGKQELRLKDGRTGKEMILKVQPNGTMAWLHKEDMGVRFEMTLLRTLKT